MSYDEFKGFFFGFLKVRGYTIKGKSSAYKIINDTYVMIQPRKSHMSDQLYIDFGLFYSLDEKRPAKFLDYHLTGNFTRLLNTSGQFDLRTIDIDILFNDMDSVVFPYLDKVSKREYIVENYPKNHDTNLSNANTIKGHDFLCNMNN